KGRVTAAAAVPPLYKVTRFSGVEAKLVIDIEDADHRLYTVPRYAGELRAVPGSTYPSKLSICFSIVSPSSCFVARGYGRGWMVTPKATEVAEPAFQSASASSVSNTWEMYLG